MKTACRILSEAEITAIKAKLPKPRNNRGWENYLSGLYLKTERIGELINFVRYGELPPNGKSRAWITLGEGLRSYPVLEGVSVFEVSEGKEIHPLAYPIDMFLRPKYTGIGRIVRWGPDGEPLVEILKYVKSEIV